MIIQFNWCELQKASTVANDQVVLMWCLWINRWNTVDFTIARSHYALKKELYLEWLPLTNLKAQGIITDTPKGLISNFTCKEPQSYCSNINFLKLNAKPQTKAEYIHLLAQRRMNELEPWIYKDMVPHNKYLTNPFIQVKDNKIHFPMEKTT